MSFHLGSKTFLGLYAQFGLVWDFVSGCFRRRERDTEREREREREREMEALFTSIVSGVNFFLLSITQPCLFLFLSIINIFLQVVVPILVFTQ